MSYCSSKLVVVNLSQIELVIINNSSFLYLLIILDLNQLFQRFFNKQFWNCSFYFHLLKLQKSSYLLSIVNICLNAFFLRFQNHFSISSLLYFDYFYFQVFQSKNQNAIYWKQFKSKNIRDLTKKKIKRIICKEQLKCKLNTKTKYFVDKLFSLNIFKTQKSIIK